MLERLSFPLRMSILCLTSYSFFPFFPEKITLGSTGSPNSYSRLPASCPCDSSSRLMCMLLDFSRLSKEEGFLALRQASSSLALEGKILSYIHTSSFQFCMNISSSLSLSIMRNSSQLLMALMSQDLQPQTLRWATSFLIAQMQSMNQFFSQWSIHSCEALLLFLKRLSRFQTVWGLLLKECLLGLLDSAEKLKESLGLGLKGCWMLSVNWKLVWSVWPFERFFRWALLDSSSFLAVLTCCSSSFILASCRPSCASRFLLSRSSSLFSFSAMALAFSSSLACDLLCSHSWVFSSSLSQSLSASSLKRMSCFSRKTARSLESIFLSCSSALCLMEVSSSFIVLMWLRQASRNSASCCLITSSIFSSMTQIVLRRSWCTWQASFSRGICLAEAIFSFASINKLINNIPNHPLSINAQKRTCEV